MSKFEVEIKVFLGQLPEVNTLINKLYKNDPETKLIGTSNQLNHYFESGSLNSLIQSISLLLDQNQIQELKKLEPAKNFSVRTRKSNEDIFIVIKSSVDKNTDLSQSENGSTRMEFESKIIDTPLEVLDQIVLNSGFKYQAKWSRFREVYKYKSFTVCIDKNAGYGYLAEFEKICEEISAVEFTKKEILEEIKELGYQELDFALLQQMFDYYNRNWEEYYGTEKVFSIQDVNRF